MRMLGILLMLLMLTACKGKIGYEQGAPAEPAPKSGDWRLFGRMPDFEVLVNMDTVSHNDKYASDKYVYVWLSQRYDAPQTDDIYKVKYRRQYTRNAIDCPSGRMAGVVIEKTDENDVEVARYEVPGYQWEFDTPDAGSYGENFVRQVCKIAETKPKLAGQ